MDARTQTDHKSCIDLEDFNASILSSAVDEEPSFRIHEKTT